MYKREACGLVGLFFYSFFFYDLLYKLLLIEKQKNIDFL